VISPGQVAYSAVEPKQIPAPDSATKRDVINRFTNVLYDLKRRGIAENRAWPRRSVEGNPRDPELL